MSNDYFHSTLALQDFTRARGAPINALSAQIEDAFDILPSNATFTLVTKVLVTAGGTADTLTITNAKPITSYATGQKLTFKAAATNTGAATVNADGLGAKAVKRHDGSALVAGDITTGRVYDLIYDGTNFVLTPVIDAAVSSAAAAVSATNAANSASAAATSATNAATSATTATTQASNASTSASAASTSATNAATSATNASNSATSASGSATNASTSATNASNSASAAATSATNAANSATSAANSATDAANTVATIDTPTIVRTNTTQTISGAKTFTGTLSGAAASFSGTLAAGATTITGTLSATGRTTTAGLDCSNTIVLSGASGYIRGSAGVGPGGLYLNSSNDAINMLILEDSGIAKFPNVGTTAVAANAVLDSGASNSLLRSTSSIKYKTDVETVDPAYNNVLGLRPVWYRSLASNDNPDWGWWGLIAEEVAAIDPRLVHYGFQNDQYETVETDSGPERRVKAGEVKRPDGVQYERLAVLLLDVVKRQQQTIDAFEARIAALEARPV